MARALCLILMLLAGPSMSDPAEDAGILVQQTFAALAETGGTAPSAAEVMAVLNDRFDSRAMALAALPEALRAGAADQMQPYAAAYQSYLARVFLEQTTGRAPATLRLLGTRQTGPAVILAATLVEAPGQPRRQVDWYIRTALPQRIVNVAVDGVLITSQQRRRFADVLEAGGLGGLIAALDAGDFDRAAGQ